MKLLLSLLLLVLFVRIASDFDVWSRFSQYKLMLGADVIDADNDFVMRCEYRALFDIELERSNAFRRSVIGNLFFVQLKSNSNVLNRGREKNVDDKSRFISGISVCKLISASVCR